MERGKETYVQRSFYGTGGPPFGVALLLFVAALYCLLSQRPLLWAVALLAVGLLLLALGMGRLKEAEEELFRFVREGSRFRHKCAPPLTVDGLLDGLRREGFTVAEYPFGNYLCRRDLGPKDAFYVLVANNDTPNCPEAEEYSGLFIQTYAEAALAPGHRYLIDLEYGPRLEHRASQYLQAVREGFIRGQGGAIFGFRLAYDTREDTLYCAEAVTRVRWQKRERIFIYANELLNKLFLPPT